MNIDLVSVWLFWFDSNNNIRKLIKFEFNSVFGSHFWIILNNLGKNHILNFVGYNMG